MSEYKDFLHHKRVSTIYNESLTIPSIAILVGDDETYSLIESSDLYGVREQLVVEDFLASKRNSV